jgi:hypothetical protein
MLVLAYVSVKVLHGKPTSVNVTILSGEPAYVSVTVLNAEPAYVNVTVWFPTKYCNING